uniref:Cadherin domain protein n=1 Tax=Enterobius vermicularis TaxID=51028 RepID=A0A0N4V4U1_ENTVE
LGSVRSAFTCLFRIPDDCLKKCRVIGLNASNVYRWEIEASDVALFFYIDQNALWTTSEFDASYFEKNRRLTILAYDYEGRKRAATFFIRPVLAVLPATRGATTYIKIGRSTAVGTKITTIGREERDVFWSLQNQTDKFVLHEASSSLYISTSLIDSDETSFILNIIRTIAPEYTIEKYPVFVEVVSENIHHPEFEECPIIITISEKTLVGSQIAKVRAIDYDEGPDGDVVYHLVGNEEMFSVDPNTGDLFVSRPLNRSLIPRTFLVVEARDRAVKAKQQKYSRCIVFVNINDTNNNAPFFLSDSTIHIKENGCITGVIHHVVAKDVDEGDNGQIVYSVVDSSLNDAFEINQTTGALTVKDCLSETASVRIRAADQGSKPNIAEQNLTVVVTPNKNFWKFFINKHYHFEVMKDIPIAGDLRELKLFSNFISEKEVFEISNTGKIQTVALLTASSYDFVVIAVSNENQSDWASIRITVSKNGSDFPRIASTSCGNLTIRENLVIPNLAQIFIVSDNLEENLQYKIVAGNERNLFTINHTTGLVSCVPLDREYKSEHFLVVVVEKQGLMTQADTCTLRVKVRDENDNPPNITSIVPDLIRITDDTKVGSVVAKVNVIDEDEGENSQVYFSLIEDASGMFDVNSETGDIIFARDLKTIHNEFVLKIRALNLGSSLPLFDDAIVRTLLHRRKPEQAHEPSFLSQRYIGFVFEGAPKGETALKNEQFKVSSTDRIIGDAPLVYSIVSGNVDNVFEIDDSGSIRTRQELDREIQAEYNLKIIGHGEYKTSPVTTAYIRVLNVNDNAPLIRKMRPYHVLESVPVGTVIGKVIATDVDVDSYIEYSIARNKFFDINRFSGVIHTKNKLDYETSSRHELKIQYTVALQAYDGVHSTTSTFVVEVIDENDNAPHFEKNFYDVAVEKNLPVGRRIAAVAARDMDFGSNGMISYNFSRYSNLFQINSSDGILLYDVQAFDHGIPPLSSAVTVRIRVIDNVMSYIPTDDNRFSFVIPEDMPAYVTFGYLKIPGTSEVLIDYQITDNLGGSVFDVDSNGALMLRRSVDRETVAEYKFSVSDMIFLAKILAGFFRVEASSKFSLGRTKANVEVRITDVNDNTPFFAPHSKSVLVSENMKANDVLMRFTASDADLNNTVLYELVAGNEFEMFRLDQATGLLYFAKWSEEALREQKKFPDLFIVAYDNGEPPKWNMTSVSVVFDIDAWSGSAPFFIVPYYQKSVFENLAAGEIVLKPRAVNRIGIHGSSWEYTLKNNDEIFYCNRSTGDIKIRAKLDYETRTSYEFSLIVRDRISRSAVVPIRVNVLGIDEYPPTFTKKSFVFRIPNTAQAGERVGIITATDRDSGIDGVVRYFFENKSVHYLTIDPETGQAFLEKSLVGWNHSTDEITVVASSGTLHSKTKLLIEIGDFSEDSKMSTGALADTSFVTVISILLLLIFASAVAFLVFKMRKRIEEEKQPQKQVYSISRGNVAVMADIYRRSPKFTYERQTMPLPAPPNMGEQTVLPAEESAYGEESARLQNRNVNEQLRKLESTIIGRSMPRSMPDSGIEPDSISLTSSVTDYLTQIGVTHNQLFDQNTDERLSGRESLSVNHPYSDKEINELIYAKVDEILSPASRINSATPVSFSVPSFSVGSLSQLSFFFFL